VVKATMFASAVAPPFATKSRYPKPAVETAEVLCRRKPLQGANVTEIERDPEYTGDEFAMLTSDQVPVQSAHPPTSPSL